MVALMGTIVATPDVARRLGEFALFVDLDEAERKSIEQRCHKRTYARSETILRMAQPDAAVPGLWLVRPLPPMHEIASMTSTTRETVNRAISQLYPSGLLKRKGRNLYIMERNKLEDMVQALQAHHLHR